MEKNIRPKCCPECGSERIHSKGRSSKNLFRYICAECFTNIYTEIDHTEDTPKTSPTVAPVVAPCIPSSEKPVAQIIQEGIHRAEKKLASEQAKHWMPFTIRHTQPCMLVFVGDPHLDNEHCNWPLLQQHIDIMRLPHVYAVNMGDITDNWVGRLIAEYAQAHVTRSEAFRLAEWFIADAGITWLVHLLGNHDTWNDGAELIKRAGGGRYITEDWRAKFRICFPNDCEFKIDAAHDHKGHSQYNTVHGQKKVALFEEPADLIIGGHKHCWALTQEENPHTHRISWYARARGYKMSLGNYDKRGQWGNQWHGASIAAVLDPRQGTMQCFSDLHTAKIYLNSLHQGKS